MQSSVDNKRSTKTVYCTRVGRRPVVFNFCCADSFTLRSSPPVQLSTRLCNTSKAPRLRLQSSCLVATACSLDGRLPMRQNDVVEPPRKARAIVFTPDLVASVDSRLNLSLDDAIKARNNVTKQKQVISAKQQVQLKTTPVIQPHQRSQPSLQRTPSVDMSCVTHAARNIWPTSTIYYQELRQAAEVLAQTPRHQMPILDLGNLVPKPIGSPKWRELLAKHPLYFEEVSLGIGRGWATRLNIKRLLAHVPSNASCTIAPRGAPLYAVDETAQPVSRRSVRSPIPRPIQPIPRVDTSIAHSAPGWPAPQVVTSSTQRRDMQCHLAVVKYILVHCHWEDDELCLLQLAAPAAPATSHGSSWPAAVYVIQFDRATTKELEDLLGALAPVLTAAGTLKVFANCSLDVQPLSDNMGLTVWPVMDLHQALHMQLCSLPPPKPAGGVQRACKVDVRLAHKRPVGNPPALGPTKRGRTQEEVAEQTQSPSRAEQPAPLRLLPAAWADGVAARHQRSHELIAPDEAPQQRVVSHQLPPRAEEPAQHPGSRRLASRVEVPAQQGDDSHAAARAAMAALQAAVGRHLASQVGPPALKRHTASHTHPLAQATGPALLGWVEPPMQVVSMLSHDEAPPVQHAAVSQQAPAHVLVPKTDPEPADNNEYELRIGSRHHRPSLAEYQPEASTSHWDAAGGGGRRETRGQADEAVESMIQLLPRWLYPHLSPFRLTSCRPQLVEVIVDEGRDIVLKMSDKTKRPLENVQLTIREALYRLYAADHDVTPADEVAPRWPTVPNMFGPDNRMGLPRTLHRISAMRDRANEVYALTYRIGRHVGGVANAFMDLLAQMCSDDTDRSRAGLQGTGGSLALRRTPRCSSLLLVGRPSTGKTTLLRDVARILADVFHKSVVIVDTSNEIAGGCAEPHPCVGSARRLMVDDRARQASVLLEAVQNHGPEVIVVDEIGTVEEVRAVRTIVQRGVMLVGTAHGTDMRSLLSNPDLAPLLGGLQPVTGASTVAGQSRRAGVPAISTLVEVLDINTWRVHPDVAESIDLALASPQGDGKPNSEVRRRTVDGRLLVSFETAEAKRRMEAAANGY